MEKRLKREKGVSERDHEGCVRKRGRDGKEYSKEQERKKERDAVSEEDDKIKKFEKE